MNHRSISLRVIFIFLFAAIITQTGCKENTLINSKVLPSNTKAGVFDTSLSCITHTYFDDTVVTSTNIGGLDIYQAVGNITDPFFGSTKGSTYFQIIPTTYNSSLYDNTAIDSVVLVLPYSGFTFGDTASTLTQTYQVFGISDNGKLSPDSAYYSYNVKDIDAGTPLSAPTTVDLKSLADTFSVNGVYYTRGLHIRLDQQAFMNRIADGQAILTSSSSPAKDFINQFNGICVKVAEPSVANTAIPYFRLNGSNIYDQAGVVVYYHHTNVSTPDTLVEPYYFATSTCAHFNSIAKTYSGSPVNNLYQSSQGNDSIIAIQNLPGSAVDVQIPGISKLPEGVIVKAELQLTLLPYYQNNYAIPEKLYALGIANGTYPAGISAGLAYNVLDRYPLTSLTPLAVLDGYVHAITRGGQTLQTYTIDIPREVVASKAAGNDVLHLHINGTQDFYGAFRMVAAGGGYPDALYRPRLFVVYSKLNK